jgi:hypothetical protein
VSIGFGGGHIYYFGLTALPEERASESQAGEKVIDGLWYDDTDRSAR